MSSSTIDLHIVPSDDPRVDHIENGLDAYNAAFGVDAEAYEQFACIAASDGGAFMGGYKAKIFAEWFELTWLYAADRGKGVGTALVRHAEHHARAKACKGMVLSTFEFQAPVFYRKMGFVECGRIPHYVGAQARFFFMKRF